MKDYYILVAEWLDDNFKPTENRVILDKLNKCLREDLVEYYNTNLPYSIAAERIAEKAGLIRYQDSWN